ncbi:MAG: hypothetical protein R2684_12670 [Pyrinomonadaceae bacterium]
MKIKTLLLFAILLLAAVTAYGQSDTQSEDDYLKEKLVGVWQDSQGVGSGLTDYYQFFENGKFKFHYNEMDGTKRVLSYSGYWNVYRGEIYLHINRVDLLLGGVYEQATGSIATDQEITGGKVVSKKISPIEKLKYGLGRIRVEDEFTVTEIDGQKFWKLSSDPTTYDT